MNKLMKFKLLALFLVSAMVSPLMAVKIKIILDDNLLSILDVQCRTAPGNDGVDIDWANATKGQRLGALNGEIEKQGITGINPNLLDYIASNDGQACRSEDDIGFNFKVFTQPAASPVFPSSSSAFSSSSAAAHRHFPFDPLAPREEDEFSVIVEDGEDGDGDAADAATLFPRTFNPILRKLKRSSSATNLHYEEAKRIKSKGSERIGPAGLLPKDFSKNPSGEDELDPSRLAPPPFSTVAFPPVDSSAFNPSSSSTTAPHPPLPPKIIDGIHEKITTTIDHGRPNLRMVSLFTLVTSVLAMGAFAGREAVEFFRDLFSKEDLEVAAKESDLESTDDEPLLSRKVIGFAAACVCALTSLYFYKKFAPLPNKEERSSSPVVKISIPVKEFIDPSTPPPPPPRYPAGPSDFPHPKSGTSWLSTGSFSLVEESENMLEAEMLNKRKMERDKFRKSLFSQNPNPMAIQKRHRIKKSSYPFDPRRSQKLIDSDEERDDVVVSPPHVLERKGSMYEAGGVLSRKDSLYAAARPKDLIAANDD